MATISRFEKVAILAATRPTGWFLAREWLAGGARVRVVARSDANLPDFYGAEVRLSVCNRALGKAVAGKTVNWIGSSATPREHIRVPDAMKAEAGLSLRGQAHRERSIVPTAGPISRDRILAIAAGNLGRDIPARALNIVRRIRLTQIKRAVGRGGRECLRAPQQSLRDPDC